MTMQDWGAIGEMVGALAVVVTLIYLAKQIRMNTHAMDEGRKLALAQTYQMRSDALQDMAAPSTRASAGRSRRHARRRRCTSWRCASTSRRCGCRCATCWPS